VTETALYVVFLVIFVELNIIGDACSIANTVIIVGFIVAVNFTR
jgi:hypothetical protein